MGNGYATPPSDGMGVIAEELRQIRRRLEELEAPTASQTNSSLEHIYASTVLPLELFRLDNSPSITSTLSTEFASISSTVPAGFTRALVSITAAARLRSNDTLGSWALLSLSPTIDGTPQITNWGSISGQMYGSATASCAEVIEDLNPGDNIQVGALAAFPGTYNLAQVSVSGFVLFLR